ncbi:MAG: hypothetical protein IJZ42_01760 [Lachnospiraceae bacterium]|nr:hypothetical protein [Lachnospiraceae bacterium]
MSNIDRIDAIKLLIGNYENRKENLKEEYKAKYEEALSDINAAITQLKIELADLVLSGSINDDIHSEPLVTFVTVKFNDKGKTYDYLWDSSENVAVGDAVLVESRWRDTQEAQVIKVFQETPAYRDYDYKSAYPIS